jgi:DNA-binding SARP family transcriptional activator/tetratricopeptide (TPR) repeat protein
VSDMWFRVLGPVEALRSGQLAEVGRGSSLSVLAGLLLSANRAVSADALADLAWDGSAAPAKPRAALQSVVFRLRRVLGSGVVETSGQGYRISASEDSLDLLKFGQLMTGADEHLAAGAEEAALTLLDEALGLWKLPVLGNVALGALHREVAPQLTERYLDAQEERAELCLRLGRHRVLVAELAGLTRGFPFRERLTACLMTALYRSDRQADALAAYEALRHSLRDELGVDPAVELRNLHLKILRADPDVAGSGHAARETARVQAAAAIAISQTPRQLPPDISDFTGREAELALVRALLTGDGGRSDGPRMAMVAGPGGVGKSALAVRAAHEIRAIYPDGQLYVDLQGAGTCPAEPGDVLARFLRGFGVAGPAIPADLPERAAMYRSVMAERRVLVMLDNAAGAAQLRPLVPAGAQCGVIVTARARVTGLPGAHPIQLGMLDDIQAVQLLGRVAGEGRISGELTEARALARLCGGLPLALRIVGARLAARPHWGLSALACRLEGGRRRLGELSHDDLDVRACLALSYRGLAPAARRLARRIGLLEAPDFPLWAAAALLDTSVEKAAELVDCLVDAQLLEVTGGEAAGQFRYRYHDLIRDFARELTEDQDSAADRAAALGRVFSALLGLAEQAHRQVYGGDYSILHGRAARWRAVDLEPAKLIGDAPLAWFEAEHLSLMAAVRQGAGLGLDELCWDLAWTAVTLFEARGFYDDWRTAQEQALAAVRRAGNRLGEAAMLSSLGARLVYQQSYASGAALCEQAVLLFAEIGDQHGQGLAQRTLALSEMQVGRLDAALARCAQARQALHAAGDLFTEAGILRDAARIHIQRGEHDAAQRLLTDALVLSRGIGSTRSKALVEHAFGELHLHQGRLVQAEQAFRRAMAFARASDDVAGEAFTQLGLAESLIGRDRGEQVGALLRDVERAAQRLGHQFLRARCRLALGEVASRQGNHAAAADFLLDSTATFERCGIPLWQARALEALAATYQATGHQHAADEAGRRAGQLRTAAVAPARDSTGGAGLSRLGLDTRAGRDQERRSGWSDGAAAALARPTRRCWAR